MVDLSMAVSRKQLKCCLGQASVAGSCRNPSKVGLPAPRFNCWQSGWASYLAQGEFRNVYTRHYDKEPRKGEIAVRKVFKTGTVFESKFFGDDLKAVDKASDFTAKFNCPRF